MKIICLGDSLTYGFAMARRDTWVSLTAEKTGFEIINKGINGDTTGGMIARFERDVLRENPSAVIAVGGANDIFTSQTSANARSNIFAMLNLASANKILFITGSLLPIDLDNVRTDWASFTDMESAQGCCLSYNIWLSSFCKIFKTPFIDFNAAFSASADTNLYLEDGLHPNAEGHKIMAETACAKLLEIFKKK
ncbi:MAG: GDSL-type esterase/lipase family protein [Elusimicrobiota bacterium]|jgi:lysophospholipase L1-like esterase|nr:GDSL-type esterase/lipase family protein [Elusimicrobiota bacterium]